MIARRVASLVVSILVTSGAAAVGTMRVPAAQSLDTAASPAVSSAADDTSQIGSQMSSLERRARFDMILYTGTFHRADSQLAAVALSLSAR